MMRFRFFFPLLAALAVTGCLGCGSQTSTKPTVTQPKPLRIGQRDFAESRILARIVGLLAHDAGRRPDYSREYVRSVDAWEDLKNGDLDVIVDYVGTIASEYLSDEVEKAYPDIKTGMTLGDIEASALQKTLKDALADKHLEMSESLGFENAYHIGMLKSVAEREKITHISDLHSELKYAFTESFYDRNLDGWKSLRASLNLQTMPQTALTSHKECYELLFSGDVHVTTPYTTDPETSVKQGPKAITILKGKFFPRYDVVLIYRKGISQEVQKSTRRLEGRITRSEMTELITRARQYAGVNEATAESLVAAEFVAREFDKDWGRFRLRFIYAGLAVIVLAALIWLFRAYRLRAAGEVVDRPPGESPTFANTP